MFLSCQFVVWVHFVGPRPFKGKFECINCWTDFFFAISTYLIKNVSPMDWLILYIKKWHSIGHKIFQHIPQLIVLVYDIVWMENNFNTTIIYTVTTVPFGNWFLIGGYTSDADTKKRTNISKFLRLQCLVQQNTSIYVQKSLGFIPDPGKKSL